MWNPLESLFIATLHGLPFWFIIALKTWPKEPSPIRCESWKLLVASRRSTYQKATQSLVTFMGMGMGVVLAIASYWLV